MARLQIYDGQERLRDVQLEKESLTLGRDVSNSVVLSDASVSRCHAEIEPAGNFYLIRDNGSTNGTFVNDMLVRAHLLAHGDIIRIGKYLLRVDARIAPGKESTRVRIEELALPGQGPATSSDRDASRNGPALSVESVAESASAWEYLKRLKRLNETIGYIRVRPDLYRRILEFFISELGVDRAVVLLAREERPSVPPVADRLRSVAARTCEEEPQSEIVISNSLLEKALLSSGAFITHLSERSDDATIMAAPLIDRDRAWGVVYVDRAFSGLAFDRDDLQFFDLAVQQAGIALSNAAIFEEMQAERGKVQAIFTNLTDGILITDSELRITDCNIASVVLLALESKNPIGRHLVDVASSFDVSPRPEHILEEANDAGSVFHLTRKGNALPNGVRNLTGRISTYPREGGDPRGFVIALRDSTELHRMERLKSEFIGNVAHKLRTPLTVIEANLPLLHENIENHSLRLEILDDIDRNSGLLCHLIDKFVEFSALEIRSTGIADMPRAVSARQLVENAAYRASSLLESRGVELRNDLPEDAPLITVRVGRLTDALFRIIENAVKFSPENSRVDIQGEVSGPIMRIHVTDKGPGIPREEIDSVFYVGHQVDHLGTGQVPGAGLGLTIARHLVQEHGGDIQIRSPFPADEGGARVTLIVPLRSEVQESESGLSAEDGDFSTVLEVQND